MLHRIYLHLANLALHGFHQVYIVFSVFGWMFCQTRLLNLIVMLLTFASWYGLGPLLGKGDTWGYCVITDIQWNLRRKLGLGEREGGYIKYLADKLLGREFDAVLVDKWGAGIFFACVAASVSTNYYYGSCPPFGG